MSEKKETSSIKSEDSVSSVEDNLAVELRSK